jgi:hypothetical protein
MREDKRDLFSPQELFSQEELQTLSGDFQRWIKALLPVLLTDKIAMNCLREMKFAAAERKPVYLEIFQEHLEAVINKTKESFIQQNFVVLEQDFIYNNPKLVSQELELACLYYQEGRSALAQKHLENVHNTIKAATGNLREVKLGPRAQAFLERVEDTAEQMSGLTRTQIIVNQNFQILKSEFQSLKPAEQALLKDQFRRKGQNQRQQNRNWYRSLAELL